MRKYFYIVTVALLVFAPFSGLKSQCASPINTIMNYNNGQDGNMFNVTAINNIFLDSVWCNFDAGTIQEVEIWWRSGTVVGNANAATGWTMIDSVVNLTSAGVNNFTHVPIWMNLYVPAGQTVGLYVTRAFVGSAGPYMRYTNGTGTAGNAYVTNADLSLSVAYGKDYPFGTSFNPRIWNGRLFYHCCPPPPAIQMAAAPTQLCSSDTFTYSVIPYAFAESYTWSAGGSGNIVGANNDSSSVQIVFNGNLVNDTVCVTLEDSCSSIDTCIAVTINPPTADAGPDTSICSTTYQLQGNNGLGAWSVVGGSGTFTNANAYDSEVAGLAPGVNTLRWSVGNANCDTVFDEVNITVNPIPVAQMILNDGCADNQITFVDNSYALGGNIIDWDWDVDGDGTFDYSTNQFQHTYTVPNVYLCTLITTANLGCKDTVIDSVFVYPNPVVDFSYDPDCEGSPMAFTDLTTISSGNLDTWEWQFGDGSSPSGAQDPAHVYPQDGLYVVTLTVTSDFGCAIILEDTVEVFSIPDVDFISPNVCSNDTAAYTDISVSTQGNLNYWEWDFGDGTPPLYTQNAEHEYSIHGTYNVKLLVGTDKGCTNIVVKPLDIYPVPVPYFTQNGECEEQTVRFKDSSVLDNMFSSTLVQWDWEFGDGKVASNERVGNFYQEPGPYILAHTPFSNHGCHTTVETEILIRPRPKAKILVMDDHVCAETPIRYRDETYFDYTYDTTGVIDWQWFFGDGNESNEQHPTNTFAKGGTYQASLIVETQYKCIDSIVRNAVVYHNPVADFVADTLEGCSPHCVTFIDKSQVAVDPDKLGYSWYFGDDDTGSDVNPTHCYSVEDGQDYYEFVVGLKVTTLEGCYDSTRLKENVVIYSNPIADFDLGAEVYSLLDPVVEITNYSEGGVNWLWHFGDSTSSTKRDPINHEYANSGRYQVSLYTESDYGCNAMLIKGVDIDYHQTLFVPKSFSPNADGINDYFEVKGEDLEFVRLWVYDRWGHEVFFGENENARWDGLYQGRVMQIGSYAYAVEYKQTNRIKEKIYGNFVISKAKDQ
ncbi:MAG: PKD domain-containing protein [Flavobacteriales bacterium]|nr:PKD domain-containing protein [Flavobacteriales bacterium]